MGVFSSLELRVSIEARDCSDISEYKYMLSNMTYRVRKPPLKTVLKIKSFLKTRK